jgi:glutamine amidotransferase
MNTVIIKYNAGNIQSVLFALERLKVQAQVTDDVSLIQNADKVIFPGVGEAGSTMRYLRERGLDEVIRNLQQPVLGICLGMQLMCNYSEEADTNCLGIFDTGVKKFSHELKIPQIGWNDVTGMSSELFKDVPADPYFYFVHSYYADLCDDTVGITDYGIKFSSALKSKNFYGVQFHPEKSAASGEQILKNFLAI